jgi:hypothetical protein
MSERPSHRQLVRMRKAELRAYIVRLEDEEWLGCGHTGALEKREKENLVAVAELYHEMAARGLNRGVLERHAQASGECAATVPLSAVSPSR